MKLFIVFFWTTSLGSLIAQTGVLKGSVFNSMNNQVISNANIVLANTTFGAISDKNGNYIIEKIKPGTYNLICSFVGFKKKIFYEVRITSIRETKIDFPLIEQSTPLDELIIQAPIFNNNIESPLSLKSISASEINRNPGSNRDISKTIQILPGVASTVSFRNDIIVRGGAPNENRFYMDGIEVPNINHFATQGSSGGPVGMINVNFIKSVDFYSGGFPANRGNALSSILEFKQVEGNDQKLRTTLMIGSSDVGLTFDGPLGKKSTFIFSARRSYLQFLFKALALPFLPTYNSFQYKQKIEVDNKNSITFISLMAIDDLKLNTKVNDNEKDKTTIRKNQYLLGNIPINAQWNYTIGVNWKHFTSLGYQNIVISRNYLNNKSIKYKNNIEIPEFLILEYSSQEIENKLRIENTIKKYGWKFNIGVGYQNAIYTNSTFNKISIGEQVRLIDFNSKLRVNKFSIFSQMSKKILKNKFFMSFGLRTDFNDYSKEMNNPFDQISPRVSISYFLSKKINVNFNIGRYYQMPSYTIMGHKNDDDQFINKFNKITYIQSDHYTAGLEFKPKILSRITLEGFFKKYNNYPFLLRDEISLANLGGDFGVIGNEPVKSISKGRSYGVEFMFQQKLKSSIYGILSYTYVISEFSNKNNQFVPSSWDNRHILNLTAGKKIKNNWELGLKFRFVQGFPYTPYDIQQSVIKEVWETNQKGVLDWSKLNEKRSNPVHSLDFRIDKKWFFNRWTLNSYIDVQNVYNFKAQGQPYIDVQRDSNGNPITDPLMPLAYKIIKVENTSGTILPSVGLMMEF